jgi:hypothetical protein
MVLLKLLPELLLSEAIALEELGYELQSSNSSRAEGAAHTSGDSPQHQQH